MGYGSGVFFNESYQFTLTLCSKSYKLIINFYMLHYQLACKLRLLYIS